MAYEVRLSRCTNDRGFCPRTENTLNTVSDRQHLYNPGLYGWDMDTVEFEFKLEDYAMVPALRLRRPDGGVAKPKKNQSNK